MGRGTRGAVEGDGRGISGSHGARRRVGQEKRWHRGCSPRRAMRGGHASPQVSTPVPQPLGRDRAGAASVPAPLRVPPGWACTTASARPCRATRAVQAARPARARKEKPPRCQKPPPLHAGLCRSLIATAIRGRSSRCAREGRSSRVTVILPDGRRNGEDEGRTCLLPLPRRSSGCSTAVHAPFWLLACVVWGLGT